MHRKKSIGVLLGVLGLVFLLSGCSLIEARRLEKAHAGIEVHVKDQYLSVSDYAQEGEEADAVDLFYLAFEEALTIDVLAVRDHMCDVLVRVPDFVALIEGARTTFDPDGHEGFHDAKDAFIEHLALMLGQADVPMVEKNLSLKWEKQNKDYVLIDEDALARAIYEGFFDAMMLQYEALEKEAAND